MMPTQSERTTPPVQTPFNPTFYIRPHPCENRYGRGEDTLLPGRVTKYLIVLIKNT